MLSGFQDKGTRVRKVNSEDGDYHPNGHLGVISFTLGGMPEDATKYPGVWFYFVSWDGDKHPQPVGTMGPKLEPV